MFLVANRQKRISGATISVGSNICFGKAPVQTDADINALIQSLTNDNQKLTNDNQKLTNDNQKLANDNQTLTSDNQTLTSEIKKLKFENMVLQEKYDLLTYKRFVHSSEQETGNNAQQSLFDEEAERTEAEAGTPEEPEKETIIYTRKKNAGRKPISAEIPREVEYIDLSEEEKRCACGAEMEKIGVDVSEKIEIVPARIFVKRMEKAKYACPCCKGHPDDPDAPSVIQTAEAPPAILPGSIASASLLSHVFSSKFENHLPYFRIEKQFAQIGVTVSRQDMVNWQVKGVRDTVAAARVVA